MIENNRCKEHTGIEHEISNLKDTVREQWKVISTMATSAMMKWVIGIFVVLSMAVVGFLWRGQSVLADKVAAGQQEIVSQISAFRLESTIHRNALQYDINVLKSDVADLKRSRKRDDK